MSFLQFEPIFQERVWGGRALGEWRGCELPGTNPIGESWEVVDREEAQSVVRGGDEAGRTLREVIEARGDEIMGPEWDRAARFPILVKWLDCAERLSLQVHPPASIARSLSGEPKTENWYVARANTGAAIMAGLKPGVDATQFRAAVENNTADQLVLRHPTRDGDSVLIESGVMHAIDGGNLILEIQQNSDTTFRVYDWGRMGLDGRPRQLHVEQSMACLAANTAPTPAIIHADDPVDVLVDAREFRLRRVRLAAGGKLEFSAGEQPRILSVVEGGLESADGRRLVRGANVLLPFAGNFAFAAPARSTVLITENFVHP